MRRSRSTPSCARDGACPGDAFGIAVEVALGALVPPAFFRYAQSLWLVMMCLVAMAEQRHERERPQR